MSIPTQISYSNPYANCTLCLGPITLNSPTASFAEKGILSDSFCIKYPKFFEKMFNSFLSVDEIQKQIKWTTLYIKTTNCSMDIIPLTYPNNVLAGIVVSINKQLIDPDKMPKDGPIIIDGDTINGQSLDNFTIPEETE